MLSRLNYLSIGRILLLALFVRICFFPLATYWYDMNAFREWSRFFSQNTLSAFYDSSSLGTAPDHLPGDLLIYAGLGRILGPGLIESILFPFAIKLIGALSDIGIGVLLWLTALKLAPPQRARTVMLCWLFNPAVIFISAIWGQLDSLSLFLALMGIVAALNARCLLCWTPLAWACLIKPQLIVVLPIILLVILYKEQANTGQPINLVRSPELRASILGWILAIGVVSLICRPFSVGILPFGVEWTMLERIQFAMDRHNNMVVGGHTLWSLILGVDAINPDSRTAFAGLTVKNVANILTVVTLLAIYVICLRGRSWRIALTWGCASVMLTMYVLPTRIHERYFLPALLFVIVFSAVDTNRRRAKLVVIASTFIFLASLLASYTTAYPIFGERLFVSALTMQLLSLGYVAIFGVVVLAGFHMVMALKTIPTRAGHSSSGAESGTIIAKTESG